MDSVLSALIGIVVGALLSGAVQTWQARQERARARRSAARLMFADYVRALGAVQFLRDTGVWWSDELAPSLAEWREHRSAIAVAIRGEAWTTVDGAFAQLVNLEDSRRAAAAVEKQEPLLADASAVDSAREAYDAMEQAGAELLIAGFTRRERVKMAALDADDGVAVALRRLSD